MYGNRVSNAVNASFIGNVRIPANNRRLRHHARHPPLSIPSRLAPHIERTLVIDFTQAVGAKWQFLPTGCFGVSPLTGPPAQDHELDPPEMTGRSRALPGRPWARGASGPA